MVTSWSAGSPDGSRASPARAPTAGRTGRARRAAASSTRSRSTPMAATPRPGAASGRPYERRRSCRADQAPCPYAELHCHSNFSFLDGASHPEELAEEARRLGLTALAITDHDGLYGVVRFAEAARALGLKTFFGAELSLGLPGPTRVGEPDPARPAPAGCSPTAPRATRGCRRVIAQAQLDGGEKGRPVYDLGRRRRPAARPRAGAHRLPQGTVPAALLTEGVDAAARELDRLARAVRRGQRRGRADRPRRPDRRRPQRRAGRARRRAAACRPSPPTTCTTPPRRGGGWRPRSRRCGPGAASTRSTRWLPAAATAHLRTGAEMAARFAAYPGAVARAAAYGEELAFDLQLVAPNLPRLPGPTRPAPR